MNILTNSIKEIEIEDDDLSWKYIIHDRNEGNITIEYWELKHNSEMWTVRDTFRIDLYNAELFFKTGLNLINNID